MARRGLMLDLHEQSGLDCGESMRPRIPLSRPVVELRVAPRQKGAGEPRGRPTSARADAGGRDPVIEAYKRHVDRTLLRQNLRRSVTERVENLMALQALAAEARRARRLRERDG